MHCSAVTAELLRIRTRCTWDKLSPHEVGETFMVREGVSARFVDANHCPGAVMVVIEMHGHTLLYTGDFRYHAKMMKGLANWVGRVDKVIFDSTFCNPLLRFPKKEQSIRAVRDVLLSEGGKVQRVYIALEMLGCEEVLVSLAQEMNIKFYIDKYSQRNEQLVMMESTNNCITDSPDTKYHIIANRMISKCARMEGDCGSKLFIKPSTLWFARRAIHGRMDLEKNIVVREGNVFHVLFSMHSDFYEIREFISDLRPKSIQPMLLPVGYSSETDFESDLVKWFGNLVSTTISVKISKSVRFLNDLDQIESSKKKQKVRYSLNQQEEEGSLALASPKEPTHYLHGKRVYICSSISIQERCSLIASICSWKGFVEDSLNEKVNVALVDSSCKNAPKLISNVVKFSSKEGSLCRVFDVKALTESCSLDCICAENYEFSRTDLRFQSWFNKVCSNENHKCTLCKALNLKNAK